MTQLRLRPLLLLGPLAIAACVRGPARSVSGGEVVTTPIDAAIVRSARLPSRVLWSWTTEKGAHRLAGGPPLLRAAIHDGPPDDAWYDLHLRESCDGEVSSLLTSPRFSHVRWAWTNPWGASDGVADEHYGDQLIRIELRPGARFARFAARCGSDGLLETGKALTVALPEWSFFGVDDGVEVPRPEALAHPESIALVYHLSPRLMRDPCVGDAPCFFAFRELVIVNEAMVARWSLGSREVERGREAARATLEAELLSDLVPIHRDDEDEYQRALAMRTWSSDPPLDALSAEDRWMLTLPFPRDRYRALPRLRALLGSQQRTSTDVRSPP